MDIISKWVKAPLRIGNAQGIIIPKKYLDILGLNDLMEITVFEKQIVIKKASNKLKKVIKR